MNENEKNPVDNWLQYITLCIQFCQTHQTVIS